MPSASEKMTPQKIRECKGVRGIAALTAYDYPLARLIDESGADIILVGDSLGMVVLGYPDTTHVTLEEMLHHCRAAARGTKRALVAGDLPYKTYRTPEQALFTARRMMETGIDAVKLEGGVRKADHIAAIVQDGIPVVGHIGMLPQNVLVEGGYKLKGRTEAEALDLIADGKAVEDAGAFAVVAEIIQRDTTRRITEALTIPTIGIGSGGDCDGQVLVTHDLIGLFPWFVPKFVKPEAAVSEDIRRAVTRYVQRVTGATQTKAV
jgi:3-methyl-2-oxobutanoate hydroxymethyltransferase